MKYFKIIGLFCLFCFTFIYTEKVIDVTIEQDEIMLKIKEEANKLNINPQNALIENDTIIPGNIGKYIDYEKSYKEMKKIGYYDPSFLIYEDIYPDVSIYNHYNLYIINGNQKQKNISLIYILNNDKTINTIKNSINKYQIPINFFIDSSFLNNNINIIEKLNNNEIYNYGLNGKYTKDNLIITNNIINNKANNKSIYCLFLEKNSNYLEKCANNKMLSIYLSKNSNLSFIKNNLQNGSIFLINNTQELDSIIEYILSKGYKIVPLSQIITEY